MLDRIGEFFKKLWPEGKGGGKAKNEETKRPLWKKLNILLTVAAAGALLIMLSNLFTPGIPAPQPPANSAAERPAGTNAASGDVTEIARLEKFLAEKLEDILAQIEGAGEVRVTVNLASTTEKEFAMDTSTTQKNTLENDKNGGKRTISEINENGKIVLVRESQGSKEMPVVVKELRPEVKGVIVVAEGAEDQAIKADLMNAVRVFLDVPLYKVIVLPLERR